MHFNQLQNLLSAARLERYLVATGGDEERAARLYRANLKLAQAFHPILGVFEVVLRNKIDQALEVYFNDPDWIINQKRVLGGRLLTQILEAENRLLGDRIPVTKGKLIASQMLGFWTETFSKPTFKILKGSPIHIFKHPPTALVRADISIRLNQIRQLRNRINHNEPICFKHQQIDCTEAAVVHQALYAVMDWIDPNIRWLLQGLDEVQDVLGVMGKI